MKAINHALTHIGAHTYTGTHTLTSPQCPPYIQNKSHVAGMIAINHPLMHIGRLTCVQTRTCAHVKIARGKNESNEPSTHALTHVDN